MSKQNIAIIAAIVVLLSAMWDPRVSVVVAIVGFVVLYFYEGKPVGDEVKPTDASSGVAKPADAKDSGVAKKESLIEKQGREKAEHKEKILELLERQSKLTNDSIQKELGISDATAERYLNELEKESKVKQVGDTGSGVYYSKP